MNEAGHLAQRDSGSGRPGRQGGRGPAGAGSEVGEAAQPGPLEGGRAVSLTEGVRAIGNGGRQLVRGHSGNFEGERRRAGHHSGDLRRERHRAGHHSGQKEPLVAACRPRRRHPRPHGTAWGQPFAASAVAGQAWPTRPRGPHSLPRTVPAPVAVSVPESVAVPVSAPVPVAASVPVSVFGGGLERDRSSLSHEPPRPQLTATSRTRPNPTGWARRGSCPPGRSRSRPPA